MDYKSIPLALYVTTRRDSGYFHIEAYPVTIGKVQEYDDTPPDGIRNPGDSNTFGGLYLSDLHATGLGSESDTPRKVFAWSVEYRSIYALDLSRAERCLTTLRGIERRTELLRRKFGSPESFGQFLAYFAQAIGAEKFVFLSRSRGYGTYDQDEHLLLSVSDGIYKVNSMIREWTEENIPNA